MEERERKGHDAQHPKSSGSPFGIDLDAGIAHIPVPALGRLPATASSSSATGGADHDAIVGVIFILIFIFIVVVLVMSRTNPPMTMLALLLVPLLRFVPLLLPALLLWIPGTLLVLRTMPPATSGRRSWPRNSSPISSRNSCSSASSSSTSSRAPTANRS